MPFIQDTEAEARLAHPVIPPTRRSRNDTLGMADGAARASAAGLDGSSEDGRTAVTADVGREGTRLSVWPPEPPVLATGMVAVLYDGGPCGRAALAHAVHASSGPMLVVCSWSPADPVVAARLGGGPSAAAQLLQALHEANERAQADAWRVADDGVALAAEAGRDATSLVWREERVAPRDHWLRELVARHDVGHLVLAGERPRSRWGLVHGRGYVERLAADPPCPCTIVPIAG